MADRIDVDALLAEFGKTQAFHDPMARRLAAALRQCRGVNQWSGNPDDWGHAAVIEGLTIQRDNALQRAEATETRLSHIVRVILTQIKQCEGITCWEKFNAPSAKDAELTEAEHKMIVDIGEELYNMWRPRG